MGFKFSYIKPPITEPLILFGEGNYALTDIKQIETTDAFHSVDEEIKNCQNMETTQECEAREFIKLGLDRCHCTPYHLRNFTKDVNKNRWTTIISSLLLLQEQICIPQGVECYEYIMDEIEKCLTPCEGVFADVSENTNFKKVEEIQHFNKILKSYKEFKTGFKNDKYAEGAFF